MEKSTWELVPLAGYGGPYSIRADYKNGKTYYAVGSISDKALAEKILLLPEMIEALKQADALAEYAEDIAVNSSNYATLPKAIADYRAAAHRARVR